MYIGNSLRHQGGAYGDRFLRLDWALGEFQATWPMAIGRLFYECGLDMGGRVAEPYSVADWGAGHLRRVHMGRVAIGTVECQGLVVGIERDVASDQLRSLGVSRAVVARTFENLTVL